MLAVAVANVYWGVNVRSEERETRQSMLLPGNFLGVGAIRPMQ